MTKKWKCRKVDGPASKPEVNTTLLNIPIVAALELITYCLFNVPFRKTVCSDA